MEVPAAPPPDFGPPVAEEIPPPAAGGGNEVDTLKQLIDMGRGYLDIPSVEESERSEMMKALGIFQKLLASNQKMADQATGATPQNRKLLGGGAAG